MTRFTERINKENRVREHKLFRCSHPRSILGTVSNKVLIARKVFLEAMSDTNDNNVRLCTAAVRVIIIREPVLKFWDSMSLVWLDSDKIVKTSKMFNDREIYLKYVSNK